MFKFLTLRVLQKALLLIAEHQPMQVDEVSTAYNATQSAILYLSGTDEQILENTREQINECKNELHQMHDVLHSVEQRVFRLVEQEAQLIENIGKLKTTQELVSVK